MSDLYPYALPFERYRELLEQDFARMRQVATTGLDRPVPGCDGWRSEDAVRHTAAVYLHKVESIRHGVAPRPWPPDGLDQRDALELFDDAYRRLVGELDAHDPSDPAWTWWPPDQSVGFWIRRMAHETSVHRHDVERAAGEPTPVAGDLAVDGIDEVLMLMLEGDWGEDAVEAATGCTVTVRSGGRSWDVTLGQERVDVARADTGRATATASGEPTEVLLWLWGRGPLPDPEGDPAAVTELRARLALATQ